MEITTAAAVTDREDEGLVVELNDQAGNPAFGPDGTTRVTVTVAGTYSKRYRQAQEANRKWLRKHRGNTDADLIDRLAKQQIAACLIAWDGFTQDGKPYPLTRDNALHVLDVMPWVREQIENAMTDHEAFFSNESTS
jgi:hypothetical protein